MIVTKKRCIRTRRSSDSSNSDGESLTNLEPSPHQSGKSVVQAIRELQNVRKRPAGISLAALTTGKTVTEETAIVGDPFKLRTGGLIDMREVNRRKRDGDEDNVEARLAMTFATETNKRDEDAEMRESSSLLRDVPENLRPVIGQQKEDMLSNQMLCGIPEVDLGVEAKMRNIEATEEAKQSLVKQRYNRRYALSGDGMTPNNVAVDFVQHRRWNNHAHAGNPSDGDKQELKRISAKTESKPAEPPRPEAHYEVERERLRAERATDSMVLQRFKTQMRGRKRR